MSVLVGRKAPNFNAKAVVNGQIIDSFTLEQFFEKKYVVLFFYPKDFTFVCPTELIAFQKSLGEFEQRNTQVIGCSTDSEYSHWAWVNTPLNRGGIQGVTYPLVADVNKTIAADYDVLTGNYEINESGCLSASSELVAYRGLFLIDREGMVRHQIINDMPLGRSIAEAVRMVDALQHFETHGEVCPMDWKKGDNGMQANHDGVSDYLSK